MRLRSRGAKPGLSQRSRKSTSVVYWTRLGVIWPNCSPTRVARCFERKLRSRRRWELIGPDIAALEDVPCSRDCVHGVRPASIKRQVRNDLGDLGRFDAVVERETEIVRQLDSLVASDQRRDGHDATVARRKPGPFPQVAQNNLTGVLLHGGRDDADVFGFRHGISSFDGCLLRGGSAASDQAERKQGCGEHSHGGLPSMVTGCAISHHATNAAQSTVIALARNRTFRLAPVAINPSVGLARPWARS